MTRKRALKCTVCCNRPRKRQLDFAYDHGLCEICARTLESTRRRLGAEPSYAATVEVEWAAKRARSAERRRGKERA
jgi:hypothetical protein